MAASDKKRAPSFSPLAALWQAHDELCGALMFATKRIADLTLGTDDALPVLRRAIRRAQQVKEVGMCALRFRTMFCGPPAL